MSPRVVFLTGGASGIGAQVARALAREGFGVVFTYRSSRSAAEALVEELRQVHPGRPFACAFCRLDDLAEVAEVARDHAQRFGPIFGLVHAAGAAQDALAAMVRPAEAEATLRVNFLSLVVLAKAFLPGMTAARCGRVVAVSSVAARFGRRGNSIYSASKAALEAYLRCLVEEVRDRGVTVNAVAPGVVDTAMLTLDEAARIQLRSRIPQGRLGAPSDVAEVVAFLMSEPAGYVQGATITVDGGLTAVLGGVATRAAAAERRTA